MVGPGMFKGVVETLIAVGVIAGAIIIGLVWLSISFFSDDEIRTQEPLKPTKIELEIINDTEIDTIYVYDLDKI